jgi:hypothetical protein
MQKLIFGIAVGLLAVALNGSAEAATKKKSGAKSNACHAEAKASCFPKCTQASYQAALRRCMGR